MKYAICNETFQDWDFAKAFSTAKSMGYDGIEFAPFTINPNAYEISDERCAEICKQLEDAELTSIGLHWLLAQTEGYYLTTPDKEVRDRTTDYFCELARLCRKLGGGVMVLGSPYQRNLLPGVTHDQAMEFAAEVIKGAVPALEECGVVMAVEPLSPAEGDFLRTADLGAELVAMVDSPTCQLHLDVKAMSSEGKPIDGIIRKHADILAHFHANDANLRGPGMGDIDFLPIMQALKDVDYDGWVSVEVFDYEPGVETLAGDSIAYLKKIESQLS